MRTLMMMVVLCAAACGGQNDAGGDTAGETDEIVEAGSPHALQVAQAEARTTAKLVYYGGPLLEAPQIAVVLWGDAVDEEVATRIGDFYKSVAASSYLDWLSEYDANGLHLGRGTLAGVYQIAPAHKASALTDAQIQRELLAQIRKGSLPAAGPQTLYAIHFPPGVRIALGSSHSCESGGFCGYHSAFRSGTKHVRYAVLPDMSAGSGCDVGCGGGGPFETVTSVASHELVEAITDPDVGLAKGLKAPLGWYDATNGEIGDICAGHSGKIRAGGASWTVQKQWSNKARACVLHGG